MSDSTISIRDALNAPLARRIMDEGAAGVTPYNAEHPGQRAELLDVLRARPGLAYADHSVSSLSAGQAAGTTTVLAANSARKALMINPPADCFLAIAGGATAGWPLFANVPNLISGQECPSNALFVVGLSTAAILTIWEA